ncbi:MAG: nucleotidyltransferase family protein [Candidatus Sulfotelmatobacter sp.]
MKAFLLAGGLGTRLRPITDKVPKCLVPIRGTPLLNIWLDLCFRSGITEVLINLHAHAETIEQYLRKLDSPVQVRVVHEEQLLGSAGTLAANRSWVENDPAFWILYSDVLTKANLCRMAEFHSSRSHDGRLATLGLYRVPDPSRCGVAISDSNGVIIGFEEKPQLPRSNWVFSGLMVATPGFLDLIPRSLPADIAFDVLPRMLGKMMAYPIHDYLLDIGTISNYQKAQITWPGSGSEGLTPESADSAASPSGIGRAERL